MSALKHLKFSCPPDLRKRFVDGLFNSILVYCLPVYGGMEKGQLQSLQILQNKAARLVLHAPPRSNREKMYKSLNWLSVNQLICYHSLISVFKNRLHKDPKYLSDKMNNDSRNGRIMIPYQNLSLAANSFCYRSATQWNKLPASIRMSKNLRHFKTKIRQWVKQNVPLLLD